MRTTTVACKLGCHLSWTWMCGWNVAEKTICSRICVLHLVCEMQLCTCHSERNPRFQGCLAPGVAMDLGACLWEMQWPCSFWERLPPYTPPPPSPRRREGRASSPTPPSPGCKGSVMAARAWRELTQEKKRHRLRERVGGGWVPDTS